MTVFFQKEATARLLKSYPLPYKGTWRSVPSQILPDDALQTSFNISLIYGHLRSRCGLPLYGSFGTITTPVYASFMGGDLTYESTMLCADQGGHMFLQAN